MKRQTLILLVSLGSLLLVSCGGNSSAQQAEAAQKGLSEDEINALFDGVAAPQKSDTLSYDTAFEVEPLGD